MFVKAGAKNQGREQLRYPHFLGAYNLLKWVWPTLRKIISKLNSSPSIHKETFFLLP